MLRPQDVVDADDVLVAEAQQDLDFPQRALAVGLVLERADLLDGHALVGGVIQGRAGSGGGWRGEGTESRSHVTRISNARLMQSGAQCTAVQGWARFCRFKHMLHKNSGDVGMWGMR